MAGRAEQAHEVLRLRIHGGTHFLEAGAAAAAAVARKLGFAAADAERLGAVVDRLCRDVVTHHFDAPEEADFTVLVAEARGGIQVRIEDAGLPYPVDRFSLDDDSLVGRLHAAGGADAVRFESRGVDGNAVELTFRPNPAHQRHLAEQANPGTTPVAADTPITVRPLAPEDAPGLARCVYRCYGYTYVNDFIYYPEQVLSLIARGLLRSLVGVTADGEVVGHCGLIRERPGSRVAESGLAVVDPRYRSHHLLGALKRQLDAPIRELDLVATYADAVTVHDITQKANAAIGARETGLLLAEIPAFTDFHGFDQEPRQRGSVVIYFHPVAAVPEREVFLPPRYRALLDNLYGRLAMPRAVRAPGAAAVPPASAIHVEVRGRRGLARIEVERAGADVLALVTRHLRELCRQRFDVIHLDLPLGDAAAMAAVDGFAALGFCFGGLIPELWQGDVLRLQYLNNVALDPARIVLYTDAAKQMLAAILAERP